MTQKFFERISPSERVMLRWLQTALFDAPVPDEPLDAAVFREMNLHAVQLLVVDYLPKELAQQASMIFVRNIRLLHEQERAVKILEEKGIPSVILKGTTNAVNYPKPLYRICGDIDLWVRAEDFLQAYHILRESGYDIDEHSGLLEDIEQPNRKHVGLVRNRIPIELHRQPFHISEQMTGVSETEVIRYMEDGLVHSKQGQMDENVFPMLPPEQTALELLIHTRKHLENGIGLRHIVDWMMFANRHLTDEKYTDMKKILVQYKLDRFAAILTRMCQMYLGLPEKNYSWAMTAKDETCAALMVRILGFGNFGRKEGISQGTRVFMRSPKQFFGMLQSGGLSNHKELLRKHGWMKPFAWVLQLGKYIGYAVENRRKLLGEYRNSKETKRLYRELM